MEGASDISATAVIPTYGSRWQMLKQCLDAARQEGVARCIVVDNNSSENLEALLRSYGQWVQLIRMGRNTGSAIAYAAGIAAALDAGAPYVLLLDDDNVVQAGGLSSLADVMSRHEAGDRDKPVAVAGYRPDHTGPIVAKTLHGRLTSNAMCRLKRTCFGFDLLMIPRKILWKLQKPPADNPAPQNVVAIPFAPYGGLLLNRSAIERIGLPDARFVLYIDDTEYTFRLTKLGIPINVVMAAKIEDVGGTIPAHAKAVFDFWSDASSNLPMYYTFRNTLFWERTIRRHGGAIYWSNAVVFFTIIFLLCVLRRNFRKLSMLRLAVRDAYMRTMGESSYYPLN